LPPIRRPICKDFGELSDYSTSCVMHHALRGGHAMQEIKCDI
jgi:hypothetical protein